MRPMPTYSSSGSDSRLLDGFYGSCKRLGQNPEYTPRQDGYWFEKTSWSATPYSSPTVFWMQSRIRPLTLNEVDEFRKFVSELSEGSVSW